MPAARTRFALPSRRALAMIPVAALALLTVGLVSPAPAFAAAQTYSTSTPVSIPDAVGGDCNTNTGTTPVTSSITVPDGGTIADVKVSLGISHTYRSDIVVDLISPSGTTINLIDRVNRSSGCGSELDDIAATLDDAAGGTIENYGTWGGSYQPMQALSAFDGQNAAGTWTLRVTDVSTEDVGTLNNWSLVIDFVADFSVADVAVAENDGTATFTITRAGDLTGTDTVNYATSNGTATAGGDYTAASGTLTFAPSQATQTVTVSLVDDAVHEDAETFLLTLSGAAGPSNPTISRAQATATISDDDPVADFSIADSAADEADGTIAFTVTRGGDVSYAASVTFETVDGSALAGSDFAAASGTLNFAAGETSHAITIDLLDDVAQEADETVVVRLSDPAGAYTPTVSRADATGTITDGDVPADFSIADLTVSEDAGTASVTVTRAGDVTVAATIDFATESGTALAGRDFTAASGTLVFAPGATTETIEIDLIDDTAHEADREFVVRVSGAAAVFTPTISRAAATVTVSDDDPAPAAVPALPSTGAVVGISSGIAVAMVVLGGLAAAVAGRRRFARS